MGRIVDDGYVDHPKGQRSCPVCRGGGLLDDGDYCAALVPCLCTGEATPDVVQKVLKSYPEMRRYMRWE